MKRQFPYVQEYTDNRGAVRRYFRRNGFRATLPGEPGSTVFNQAYAAALSGSKAQDRSAGPKPIDGSLNALVIAYYASEHWRELKETSKAPRRRILENLREKHGDKPVALLPKAWVKAQMAEKASTPAQANRWLQPLRQILDFAIDEEWMETNPARLIKKYRDGPGQGLKRRSPSSRRVGPPGPKSGWRSISFCIRANASATSPQ